MGKYIIITICVCVFACTYPSHNPIQSKEIQANIAIENFNPNYDLSYLKWQISKLNYLHKAVVDINCKKDADKKNAFAPKSVLLYNLSIVYLEKEKNIHLNYQNFQANNPPSDSGLTIGFNYMDSLGNFYCTSSSYFTMAGFAPFSAATMAKNLPKICYHRSYPNYTNDIVVNCAIYDEFQDYATYTQYLQFDSLNQDKEFCLFILQNPDSVNNWLREEALRRTINQQWQRLLREG